MSVVDRLLKLEQVHQLIKMKATGSPDEFANKIGKSRKTVYNIINELQDMGAIIEYNMHELSFEYTNDFEFKLEVNGEKIVGGKNNCTGVIKLHAAY
jgi:DNA-binding Lrp family transcriptional regulator